MLLVQENTMKLGGVKLPGQVEKISVSETASIEDIQDDKGKTRSTLHQQRHLIPVMNIQSNWKRMNLLVPRFQRWL